MTIQARRSRSTDEQLHYERKLLEEARDEVRSGWEMDEAEVKAWLAGLDGEEDLPIPELRPPHKITP